MQFVFAQPILTQSMLVPVIGDTYVLYDTDTSIQAGGGGANASWTFNNLSFTYSQTTHYIDNASSPYPNAFPTASIVEETNNTQYGYLSVTASNMLNLGSISGGNTLKWTPPITVLCYPLTFLTACPRTYYTSNYLGDSISGYFDMTCDGYGTLEINGQIYTNCLRVKRERHETFFSSIAGQINIIQVDYNWYDGIHKFPLLYITTVNSSGIVSLYIKKVSVNSIFTGIEDSEKYLHEVNLFPNPANTSTFLSLSHLNAVNLLIRVLDQKGSEIIRKEITTNNINSSPLKLDLTGINPGFYFVNILGKEINMVKKLIIY